MTDTKNKKKKKKVTENNSEEYGVVFKKDKERRSRIYPQKGKKKPTEDEDTKIV
ncbi:MAG: hypothetical protein JW776_09330 [Candidatus Lokiarchaeota archaeon]|nr:hypothetical protein [Candidatus Lokiarchaeota archaeon]